MSDYKLESKVFNGIEMISQKELFEFANGRIVNKYKNWSKFKTWPVFKDNKITDDITYHCHRKDFTPLKETNNYALHYISKKFIQDLLIEEYGYDIDPSVSKKVNESLLQEVTTTEPLTQGLTLKERLKKNTIKNTPQLLELDNDQKFIDYQERICDIRVYGDKTNKYISLVDIEREFEYKFLCKNILNGRIHLEPIKDIVTFNSIISDPTDRLNRTMYARLHVTEDGLMKLITHSNNPTMVKYNEWLKKAFFINLMGTTEERLELASELLKTNMSDALDVINKSNSELAVVYIIEFINYLTPEGNIKPETPSKLKKIVNILIRKYGPSVQVKKFGFTKKFKSRLNDYKEEFGEYVSLHMFQIIDPNDDKTCERYLREQAIKLKCKAEIGNLKDWFFSITDNDFIQYKDMIADVGVRFGHNAVLNEQIRTAHDKITLMTTLLENEKEGRKADKREYDLQLKLERSEKKELENKLELGKKELEMEKKGREADAREFGLKFENLELKNELLKIQDKIL